MRVIKSDECNTFSQENTSSTTHTHIKSHLAQRLWIKYELEWAFLDSSNRSSLWKSHHGNACLFSSVKKIDFLSSTQSFTKKEIILESIILAMNTIWISGVSPSEIFNGEKQLFDTKKWKLRLKCRFFINHKKKKQVEDKIALTYDSHIKMKESFETGSVSDERRQRYMDYVWRKTIDMIERQTPLRNHFIYFLYSISLLLHALQFQTCICRHHIVWQPILLTIFCFFAISQMI